MPTDKKITELTAATAINATDVSVLVNGDTDYQYTFTMLLQFLQANLTTGAKISFGTVLPQNTTGSNADVFVNTASGSFAQKLSGTWTVVYTLPAANAADGTLLFGSGVPSSTIGKNLDSYINTLTGVFYKKSADAWAQVFSMATGPQGPQGTAGSNGTNGADGNTILFGSTNPSNTLTGVNGNFYINTTTYMLFGPKTTGAWGDSVSLLGPGIFTGGTTGQVLVKVDGTDFNTDWQDNSFANLTGEPSANSNLSAALAAKQDTLGFTPENTASKNQANGYPGLDGSGKVAAAQLPSYVDDVLEFANFTALPSPGETGKIYVTLDTNAEYRWSGSTYIQLVASPGSTDAVPEGTTNKYFTAARVLSTVLTGIGFSTTTAITATDSILSALGKLQAQVTALISRALPTGGTTGQVLAKIDSTDGNTHWIDVSGGGVKASSIDINAGTDDTKFITAYGLDNSKYQDQYGAKISATASGTNTYTASLTPTITSYTDTQVFFIKFINANTGAATLNLNTLGAKALVKNGATLLNENDILPGQIVAVAYDGTNFQIANSLSSVLPTVTSGEKVITVTSAGAQKNYATENQIVSGSPLTGADFSTGVASATGFAGQTAYDTTYLYYCITDDNWVRTLLAGKVIDIYLADIDDSTKDKTSADLQTSYASSLPGQQVMGTNNLYIKKNATLWLKTPITIA